MALFLTALLTGLTWLVLAGGWRRAAEHVTLGSALGSVVLGLMSVAAAIWVAGIEGGIAIILVVMVHEYGHVAAFRVAGHADAQFRLIPFLGGIASSSRLPASRGHDVYITAMGPGICLALMCAAFVGSELAGDTPFGDFLSLLGYVTAVLNAFNLLPIWPLDGGRMVHAVIATVSPSLATRLMYAFCALIMLGALFLQSVFGFVLALIAFQSVAGANALSARLAPLTFEQAVYGALAWLLMLGCFGYAAHPIVLAVFLG